MAFLPLKARQMKDTVLAQRFCYGNFAFFLGRIQQSAQDATHRWTVYVRGPNNESLEHVIKKVHFRLHESFEQPLRVIDKPPYEVTEMGWGEFDIKIKIFFHDSRQEPVEVYHGLKLFSSSGGQQTTRKPEVSEKVDEFVFVDPTEVFYKQVLAGQQEPKRLEHDFNEWWDQLKYHDQAAGDERKLEKAAKIVSTNMDKMQRRLADLEQEIDYYRKLNNPEADAGATATTAVADPGQG